MSPLLLVLTGGMIKVQPHSNGSEIAGTGGGPPGVHVRRQTGQKDTHEWLEQSQNGEMLGMERDFSQSITQEEYRLDTQGEQEVLGILEQQLQQHELQQGTWGEAQWEEIVHRSHQGQETMVGPPTHHCTHLDQRRHGEQCAMHHCNRRNAYMLVGKNLASIT
jgi:hypothetical protein